MAEEKNEFKYDPESEENTKVLRLPFALCKSHGIPIKDWWTPRDAWEALRNNGFVSNPSKEMEEYFRKIKRENQKASAKEWRKREKAKKKQLADVRFAPDKDYEHKEGKIAGVKQKKPMNFKQADNGNCNPYFSRSGGIGFRHNCQTCVAVYMARRKGYDVYALPNLNNKNIYELSYDTSLAYLDKNGKHPNSVNIRGKAINQLQKELKEDGLYTLEFSYVGRRSGHIITVEKLKDGSIQFYDPQTNNIYKDLKAYGRIEHLRYMDITDCTMDEKFCNGIMKSTQMRLKEDKAENDRIKNDEINKNKKFAKFNKKQENNNFMLENARELEIRRNYPTAKK